MAFSWHRQENSFSRHPKTGELAAALEDKNAGMYVIRFWEWLGTYASRGRFKKSLAEHIERWCEWSNEPGRLLQELVRVGFVDDVSADEYEAHDWWEHQQALVQKAEKDAARKRRSRRNAREREGLPTSGDGHADKERDAAGTRRDETRRDETRHDVRSAAPAKDTAPLPISITAPTSPPSSWVGDEFWRWAQAERQEAGLLAEKPPHPGKLSAWWSAALATVNGEVARIQEAFLRFGDDPYWQKQQPKLPFAGFMSQWSRFDPGATNAA